MGCPGFWDSCAQNKTSEILKNAFQEFWDSCAQNKASEVSKHDFQEFWDSCAQNKTAEISNKCTFINFGTLVRTTKLQKSKKCVPGILGLLCAEQNVEDLKKYYYI